MTQHLKDKHLPLTPAMGEHYYQNLVASSMDAIITKDLNSVVLFWNKAAESIFGYTAQEMIGYRSQKLIPADLQDEEKSITQKIARGQTIEYFETRRVHKNGSIVYISATLSPVRDSKQEIVGWTKIARDITREYRLRTQLQLAQDIITNANDAIIAKTLSGVVTSWNKGAELIFGYSAQEMIAQPMLRLFPPDKADEENLILEKIKKGERIENFETLRLHKSGKEIHVSVTISPIKNISGEIVGVSKIAKDITFEWNNRNRLKLVNEIYQQSPDAVVLVSEQGLICEVNPSFTTITGYTNEEIVGQSPLLFHSGNQGKDILNKIKRDIHQHHKFQGEVWIRKKDGSTLASFLTISKVSTQSQSYYAGTFSDVTVLKMGEEQLLKMLHYDPLTALPNRLQFANKLLQYQTSSHLDQTNAAIIYIDLDDFSSINEKYGHETGDKLIVSVAKRIHSTISEHDYLARFGSDEFTIYLSNAQNDDHFQSVIGQIMRSISNPQPIENSKVQVSSSIGVSFYATHQMSNSELFIRQAYQAMIAAKQSGKKRYKVFNPDEDQAIKLKLSATDDILNALMRDEFVMHYQPKVNLKSGELVGVEALIRWQHPEKGLLMPAKFLPSIVDNNVKKLMSEKVVELVFKQQTIWNSEGNRICVSLNIYINQLQESFLELITQMLARYPQVRAEQVEFELLETDALLDADMAIDIISKLQALGFSFSIDDFGSGYSSLTYLRKIPSNTIKIDKEFVLNDGLSHKNIDIVKAIIELANIFKRQILAEGVETIEMGEKLIELGCDFGQGYAIAKPMSPEQLNAWIPSWQAPEQWTSTALRH